MHRLRRFYSVFWVNNKSRRIDARQPRQTIIIRTGFFAADFPPCCVKILVNPKIFAAFYALHCKKSVTGKNLRPKMSEFLCGFLRGGCNKAFRLIKTTSENTPKIHRFRLVLNFYCSPCVRIRKSLLKSLNPTAMKSAVSLRAARCFPEKGKHRQISPKRQGRFLGEISPIGGGAQGNCRFHRGRVLRQLLSLAAVITAAAKRPIWPKTAVLLKLLF